MQAAVLQICAGTKFYMFKVIQAIKGCRWHFLKMAAHQFLKQSYQYLYQAANSRT